MTRRKESKFHFFGKKMEMVHDVESASNTAVVSIRAVPLTVISFPDLTSAEFEILHSKKVINITGKTKGKGFTGTVKKGQRRGPMSHGSGHHRGKGSTGTIAPNHVRKGGQMPGKYGNKNVTIVARIRKVDPQRKLIYIEGSLPGHHRNKLLITERKYGRY